MSIFWLFYTPPPFPRRLGRGPSGLQRPGVHFNGLPGSREALIRVQTHFFARPTRGRVRCTLSDGALRSERH
jgi:hypothetical protein